VRSEIYRLTAEDELAVEATVVPECGNGREAWELSDNGTVTETESEEELKVPSTHSQLNKSQKRKR
jgi:hypothetical protein